MVYYFSLISGLTLVDQTIKFILKPYIGVKLNSFLYPNFNKAGTTLSHLAGIPTPPLILLGLTVLVVVLAIELYRYYSFTFGVSRISMTAFILILSCAICGVFDPIFHMYTIDYLKIGSIILDMKDIYGLLGFGLGAFELVKNKAVTFKTLLKSDKEFLKFFFSDMKALIYHMVKK